MRILLILAGLTLSLAAASQEIYRWVDKDGIVHYSDQPDSPNAELISVIESNSYEGEEATPDSSDPAADSAPEVSSYGSLSMVQPSPNQVFFGADAVVTAVAELQGSLQPGHSVVFSLNGDQRPSEGLATEFSGLARGTYYVSATILDQNGTPVISSQQTTFHVRQPSINSPQSPLAPKPPAKPTPKPTPKPATPPARN